MASRKKAASFKGRCKIIISPNARPITTDDICFLAFGMSFDTVVREIIENKDGKWDHIYAQPKP